MVYTECILYNIEGYDRARFLLGNNIPYRNVIYNDAERCQLRRCIVNNLLQCTVYTRIVWTHMYTEAVSFEFKACSKIRFNTSYVCCVCLSACNVNNTNGFKVLFGVKGRIPGAQSRCHGVVVDDIRTCSSLHMQGNKYTRNKMSHHRHRGILVIAWLILTKIEWIVKEIFSTCYLYVISC